MAMAATSPEIDHVNLDWLQKLSETGNTRAQNIMTP